MKKEIFNDWAISYNKTIKESDEKNEYPFAGYGVIQKTIHDIVKNRKHSKILEMGIGTGLMTKRLYNMNYSIVGVDFSTKMINEARHIMPLAEFIEADFFEAATKIKNSRFDIIIFSYSIHHLELNRQKELLFLLFNSLNDNGVIIIGDVMTETIEEMKLLSNNNSRIWDYEEFYPTVQEYKNIGVQDKYKSHYRSTSFCSGILLLEKRK